MDGEKRIIKKLVGSSKSFDEPSEYAFQRPFQACFVGSSNTGKSIFVCAMLLDRNAFLGQFDAILVVSPPATAEQACWTEVRKTWKQFIVFSEMDPDKIMTQLQAWHSQQYSVLLIFDDSTIDMKGKNLQMVQSLFTRARHMGVDGIVNLSQSMYSQDRLTRIQCSYVALFNLRSNKDEVRRYLSTATGDKDLRALALKAYSRIVQKDGGFLLLDWKASVESTLRARDSSLYSLIPELKEL